MFFDPNVLSHIVKIANSDLSLKLIGHLFPGNRERVLNASKHRELPIPDTAHLDQSVHNLSQTNIALPDLLRVSPALFHAEEVFLYLSSSSSPLM